MITIVVCAPRKKIGPRQSARAVGRPWPVVNPLGKLHPSTLQRVAHKLVSVVCGYGAVLAVNLRVGLASFHGFNHLVPLLLRVVYPALKLLAAGGGQLALVHRGGIRLGRCVVLLGHVNGPLCWLVVRRTAVKLLPGSSSLGGRCPIPKL